MAAESDSDVAELPHGQIHVKSLIISSGFFRILTVKERMGPFNLLDRKFTH